MHLIKTIQTAFLLFIILLASSLELTAQRRVRKPHQRRAPVARHRVRTKTNAYIAPAKTWWIQYNPLNILEPEIPVAATVMYKYSKKASFSLDAGVFVATREDPEYDLYGPSIRSYSGFRIKPQLKHYWQGEKYGPQGWYISLQGLVKYTKDAKEDWLRKTDANGMPLQNERVAFKEKKNVYGLNIIAGWEIPLGKEKRWMIDFFVGMGARYKTFKAEGLPAGFSIDYDNPHPKSDAPPVDFTVNGLQFSLPGGLKIGYSIR